MRTAIASSTKARTFATTPMPSTDVSCSRSPEATPGRYSTRRRFRCCAMNTRCEERPKSAPIALKELVQRMQDVNPEGFMRMIREYNSAVKRDVKFDPNIKDGKCTVGLAVNKTNWAHTIEKPPFEAYSVGCGITFTFGGLKIDPSTHVLDIEDTPIPGLYAAGELVGGLFYFNYPGSAGLMAGAVLGRIAGREARGIEIQRRRRSSRQTPQSRLG